MIYILDVLDSKMEASWIISEYFKENFDCKDWGI